MALTFQEVADLAVEARKRIRSEIYETPLIPARNIGKSYNAKVLFKAENFQLTGSFKLRGASSKMSSTKDGVKLITASSGNHGIASACAAKKLSRDLTVVLPENVSQMKLKKIRSYGVEVIIHGAECGLAENYAQKLAKEEHYAYISPYNDIDVVAGQGSIALELLEQCEHVDNVFIAMGGGGLISGIGSVLKRFSPKTRIYGVSASNSEALAASMAAGKVVETEHLDTLAGGVAGGMDEDSITLALAQSVVDVVLHCSEEQIRQSMVTLALEENLIVEGSAALALAGYDQVADDLKGQTCVLLMCGGNVDREQILEILDKP